MPTDTDKYPTESGRRRFIKGVVGSASLAAVGMTGSVVGTTVTGSTGSGGGITKAMTIENIAGPAPRGMPQIPIEITDNGELKGTFPEYKTKKEGGEEVKIAEMQVGGRTYSSNWFQYCGVQTYEGLQPGANQENFFLSAGSSKYQWQSEVPKGNKLKVDHFQDYKEWGNDIGKSGIGKPAMASWRSKDTGSTIPVQVLRSTKIEELVKQGGEHSEWLKASTANGFIAWLDKCTHYCCVPGFKSQGSAKFNAENEVYCQCHQSVYDPFSIKEATFTALPRPKLDSSSSSSGGSSNSSGGGGH